MSHEKLQAAFAEALGIPTDSDFASLEYRGIEEWDSVAHMMLVAEIEAAFDIMLETRDVLDMSSYTEAVRILGTYGVMDEASGATATSQ